MRNLLAVGFCLLTIGPGCLNAWADPVLPSRAFLEGKKLRCGSSQISFYKNDFTLDWNGKKQRMNYRYINFSSSGIDIVGPGWQDDFFISYKYGIYTIGDDKCELQ